ncbi:MAG: DnaJ domain-containing protein [Desulfovibrionaceae bacterium]|nr:DnaJ domain-containing protein [Desulfovibrionaceae bacterium]MBF0512531.1 DnaJ domain-containing protein [Desulfovibrionaceae bacterium]
MNFTSAQFKNQSRHGAFKGRDWNALEKRLSETREMLKEILANLQLVLQNLRAVNRLSKDQGSAGPGLGAKTAFGHAAGADKFTRVKREYSPFNQTGQANRFKSAASGFQRAASFSSSEPGGFDGGDKDGKNPYARTEQGAGANRDEHKTGAASQERARQKAKDASSAGTRAKANGRTNTAQGGASSGASGRQYTSSQTGQTGQAGQTGSSRREYRRPFRPRGEMTVERARAILCLSSARNVCDIKSAYRKKARQYHPDLGGDEEMMKDLNLAYDLLLQYHFSHQAPTERNQ